MNRFRIPVVAVVSWLVLGVLAALIYRPDRALPFDVWDFREFLPILQSRSGVIDGYSGLLEYYTSHGRMNPVFYLTFAVQYELFGENAHLWQLLRFAVMMVNVGLVMALVRRLGSGALAATLAGGLMVVATPVVRGWVQLMAEPMALTALLVAALLAVDYQAVERYRRRALLICCCLLFAFLSKEIVGTLGAVVVLLALSESILAGGRAQLFSRRNLTLSVGALGVA